MKVSIEFPVKDKLEILEYMFSDMTVKELLPIAVEMVKIERIERVENSIQDLQSELREINDRLHSI